MLRATRHLSLQRLLGIDRVDGMENQLLLNGGVRLDVLDGSVLLDRRVVRDDAETRAGGVQKHAVEASHHFGELETIVVGDDGVRDTQTMQIGHCGHQTLLLQDVVTGEILGSGANGDGRVVDLETQLAPVGERVQVDAAIDQRLRQITTTRLQGVGADDEGAVALVRLEPFQTLLR